MRVLLENVLLEKVLLEKVQKINIAIKVSYCTNNNIFVQYIMMTYQNSSYPSGLTNRSNFYKSLFNSNNLVYNKTFNNCTNTLCYTYSKNYVYKPHSAYGMVGTSAAGYLGRRNRL